MCWQEAENAWDEVHRWRRREVSKNLPRLPTESSSQQISAHNRNWKAICASADGSSYLGEGINPLLLNYVISQTILQRGVYIYTFQRAESLNLTVIASGKKSTFCWSMRTRPQKRRITENPSQFARSNSIACSRLEFGYIFLSNFFEFLLFLTYIELIR